MKQELLAPAGNLEAGYAALYYGADAVYLGLQKFSARAGAENFDEHALDEFTAYAHSLGRKVYAAINTIVQESELDELLSMLDMCSRYKVDAIILQDLGVARIIKESYPELELHASTQMAVHNKEGALFLQKMGFSRVVLARELTLKEIEEITAIEGLETEAFIHGALCYSYSGLCQFSALEMGRSANRGKCMYPCRGCFKTENGNKHLFSMKDMALQSDVLKMPVTSLKIEGRKKSPLYVAAVTDYYRRILDHKGEDVSRAENIRQIFSRPWCKFHFNGKNKNVIDPDFVGHRGLYLGKIEKTQKNKIFLTLDHDLGRYDGLQIDVAGREKPFGFSVQNIRVNSKNCFEAQKGQSVEIEVPFSAPKLERGMKVYLASSTKVKSSYPVKKPKVGQFINAMSLDVVVEVKGESVKARYKNYESEIKGHFEKAEQPEKVKQAFETAFLKTGGTSFELASLEVINPQGLFVPVSVMNELRRQLYGEIVVVSKKGTLPLTHAPVNPQLKLWSIKIDHPEYLSKLNLDDFAEIIYLLNPQSRPEDLADLPKEKIRLALPTVCRHPALYDQVIEKHLESGFYKWEAANYWVLENLPLQKIDITFDSSLYMMNTQAVEQAGEIGASGVCLAIEDTLSNIKDLAAKSSLNTTLVVYQDAPLFISAGCIRRNKCQECQGGEKWYEIEKDGQKYQALSKDCQVMLFSKNPFCIAEESAELSVTYRRMDFCYKKYTSEDVKNISQTLMSGHNVTNSSHANINSPKI